MIVSLICAVEVIEIEYSIFQGVSMHILSGEKLKELSWLSASTLVRRTNIRSVLYQKLKLKIAHHAYH